MPPVKAWKLDDPKIPSYPDDFEVVNKAVLQVTDIKSNHNKYYAVEVHSAELKGTAVFRVFTHYGRTDDLDTNPDAGQKECRFFGTLAEAQANYESIYREKTSTRKGYKEISLASSRIGSTKARGKSSGEIDDATLKKAAAKATASEAPVAAVETEPATAPAATAVATLPPPSAAPEPPASVPLGSSASEPASWTSKIKSLMSQVLGSAPSPAATLVPAVLPPRSVAEGAGELHPKVSALVEYIYREATSALTSTVAAKITAQGIETPLGILTLGQIQKGEAILQELYGIFQAKKNDRADLVQLSGDFYTVIPHRIGRTRAAVEAAVIDSLEAFEQKQETLQLMKDMLQVNGEGNVLYYSQAQAQYDALRCDIGWVDPASPTYREIRNHIVNSQVKTKSIKVGNVFTLRREPEWRAFTEQIGNQRLMFHGSRIRNWVGILSRGILLPKIVVSLGVNRTDAGWLGNGIYFGDAACTSAFYTSPGRSGTRYMSLARVALGRMKEFTKITYGLAGPPSGYDSCHGLRNSARQSSQFADDEYVIYNPAQQKLEYLAEFRM
jgi:predicted DNA-binding WGR domain protein